MRMLTMLCAEGEDKLLFDIFFMLLPTFCFPQQAGATFHITSVRPPHQMDQSVTFGVSRTWVRMPALGSPAEGL